MQRLKYFRHSEVFKNKGYERHIVLGCLPDKYSSEHWFVSLLIVLVLILSSIDPWGCEGGSVSAPPPSVSASHPLPGDSWLLEAPLFVPPKSLSWQSGELSQVVSVQCDEFDPLQEKKNGTGKQVLLFCCLCTVHTIFGQSVRLLPLIYYTYLLGSLRKRSTNNPSWTPSIHVSS